ncbi:helix-turn-helix domain-containing protein [Pseudonocardia nigra]|uniref:helix-turn-helix domain-containing protein n=1 Tax=Pseudonocardia nigra TaxID=1921578 RepID=UPI001C5F1864|nr:helix-turn-helix transcriptional regulator [Pseudonocardia nigra]
MNSRSSGGDELSRTLRKLRKDAELPSAEAARRAEIGQATLSRYETGKFVPTPQTVAALATVYEAPAAMRRRLIAMATDLRAEHRRVVMHRGAANFQERVGRIEASSKHVGTFQPTVVPGLLQTEEYMRALFGSGLTGDELDRAVANRLQRQTLLGEPGHEFTQIITAGALLWCAGGPEIMIGQIERLIEVTRLDGVRLGIVPPRTPATVFPLHGFDVYDERAVIVGTIAATALLTEPPDVAAHMKMLRKLEELAAFGAEARRVLTEVAEDYRHDGGPAGS